MRCKKCGSHGDFRCPYIEERIVKAVPAKTHTHPIGDFCPECKGGKVTHRRPIRGQWIVVCPPPEEGWEIYICGTAHNRRMEFHYSVSGTWCGTAAYAFWIQREGGGS